MARSSEHVPVINRCLTMFIFQKSQPLSICIANQSAEVLRGEHLAGEGQGADPVPLLSAGCSPLPAM